MKYDFDLDLVSNNSLFWIVEQLKPGSVVLEFGPANGRLTRYMKEKLHCKVYLVEIDEEAGKQALQYAEDLVVGDIETYEWVERYQNIKFDFFVFADVLEHLRNPERVLAQGKHLLKPDGTVLLSVPNFAHNSVLINLLKNRLEYTTVGLLDDTHIHMFTKESLENMLGRAGYVVSKRIGTYRKVGENEIINSVEDIEEIDKSYWLQRDYGEVYQFVYAAKTGTQFVTQEVNDLIGHSMNYYAQLFCGTTAISEDSSIKQYIPSFSGIQNLEFCNIKHGKILRFDPLNAPCVMELKSVVARIKGEQKQLPIVNSNAQERINNVFMFTTEDPIIEIDVDTEEDIESLDISLEYVSINAKQIQTIAGCVQHAIQESNERILECQQQEERFAHLKDIEEKYEKLEEEYEKLEEECEKIRQNVSLYQDAYAQKDEALDQIMNSKRWKIANLFRRSR